MLLVGILCLSARGSWADGASTQGRKAESTADHVVKAYPATVMPGMEYDQLEHLQKRIDCGQGPFAALPPSASPKTAAPGTAYLVHIVVWSTITGSYAPDRNTKDPSKWYVFRPVASRGQCSYEQTGFKANNQPSLYGIKTVWFVGINYFKEAIDQRNLALAYRISTTPSVAENVQDLGLLISGILGATPAATNLFRGGICPLPDEAPQVNHALVTVAKIYGTKRLPFDLNVALSLSMAQPGGLPEGRVGLPYSSNIAASGGSGTYVFAVVSGTLPDGLGVDPTSGLVSGTPKSPGTNKFRVQVTDTSNPPIVSSVDVALNIEPGQLVSFPKAGSPPTPGPLPDGVVSVPYASGVAATGGKGSYSFTYTGNLPPGISMSSATGAISGTPLVAGALPHTFRFRVRVVDNAGADAPANDFSYDTQITISSPYAVVPPDLASLAGLTIPAAGIANVNGMACGLPPARQGIPYLVSLKWRAGSGTFTYGAAPPQGLAFNADGSIIGTPTVAGSFPFDVQIQGADQSKPPVKARLSMNVLSDATIDFAKGIEQAGILPAGAVGQNYVASVSTKGAKGVVSYSLDTGNSALRKDVSIDPSQGIISGIPSVSGDFEVVVKITDRDATGKDLQDPRLFLAHIPVNQPLISLSLGGAGSSASTQSGTGRSQSAGGGKSGGQGGGSSQQAGGNGGTQGNANAGNNSQTNQALFDCSSVSSSSPCSFTTSFHSDDKEAIDFSLGVTVPGIHETVYTNPTTSSVKRHTDIYAFVDFYPAFHWKSKESAIPHLNFGVPVTSQPFYRPYFGAGENLTSWWLERHGFPLRINFFAGLVYMKQRFATSGPNSTTVLATDRAWKPVYGLEIPVSALISKIGSAGKSQASKGGSGGGSGAGSN